MVATVGANWRSPASKRAADCVVGRAGQPDAHAVERNDLAVLELRQRLAVRSAQVGGIERETWPRPCVAGTSPCRSRTRGFRATKMSGGIRLVSAMMCAPRSMPDISEGESVSPACAKMHVPALGALGLDDGREPRESRRGAGRPAPVWSRHQVDVVDQDESDGSSGFGIRGRWSSDWRRGRRAMRRLGGVWRTWAAGGRMRVCVLSTQCT